MEAARCSWLLLTTLLVLLACSGAGAAKKLTHLRFYYHEVPAAAGPNATIATVASLNKTDSAFGMILVYDNALREGADPSSRIIGRARGTAVVASLDSTGSVTTTEFVFTDYGNYSGSTLASLGHFIPTDPKAERSIVGGTGVLRFAQGYFITDLFFVNKTYEVALIDMYFTTAL